jgi:hypothetical protein
MSYDHNIFHMWQGQFTLIMLYEQIKGFLILFQRFNLEACNVCKVLMKGSHNLSVDVKITKNIRRPSCRIIANNFFTTFQNNKVSYINLPNHNNINMIWRYYLNLFYFVFDKFLKFYHIVFFFIFTPNQNLWLFGWKV